MTSWEGFAAEAPDLAASVRRCFEAGRHCTLATLRSDGAPRISGTEAEFRDGDLWLGSMPGAVKALDLRRDSRFALHSPTVDPPSEDPSLWAGEAKVAGHAVDVSARPAPAGPPSHRFRLDITEAVFTHVSQGGLEIESWHEGRGTTVHRRG